MSDEVPPPVPQDTPPPAPQTPVTPETPVAPAAPQTQATPPAPAGPLSPSDEKMWVLALHLSQLASFVPPLVIWLMMKDRSPAIDAHGKEVMNFQITLMIGWFICFILSFVVIGALLMPLLMVAALVFIIIGSVKTSNGEFYRYPLTIRFIK